MSRLGAGQGTPVYSCFIWIVACPCAVISGLVLRDTSDPMTIALMVVLMIVSILAFLYELSYNIGNWLFLNAGSHNRLRKILCRVGLYKQHCSEE